MATYNPIARASFSSTSFAYSPLLSDGDDVVSRTGTIASGLGIHKRGEIMKMDPATGALTVPVAAVDCNCVLANDVDATSVTAAATVYVSGKMKADAIIWPGALGHGLVSDALRDYGILIESVVYTDGTLVKAGPLQQEAQAAQTVVEHNRSELEALKAAPPAAPATEPITVDSPWAYLTAEEREKTPELAQMPTAQELSGAVPPGTLPDVPGVTITPTSQTVLASGGSGSISVAITSPGVSGTWTVEPEASATWLTFSPLTPQSADGTVTFTAAPNLTGAARVGHCYINGKTFTCNQGAV